MCWVEPRNRNRCAFMITSLLTYLDVGTVPEPVTAGWAKTIVAIHLCVLWSLRTDIKLPWTLRKWETEKALLILVAENNLEFQGFDCFTWYLWQCMLMVSEQIANLWGVKAFDGSSPSIVANFNIKEDICYLIQTSKLEMLVFLWL